VQGILEELEHGETPLAWDPVVAVVAGSRSPQARAVLEALAQGDADLAVTWAALKALDDFKPPQRIPQPGP
jgi:hypothetical protein